MSNSKSRLCACIILGIGLPLPMAAEPPAASLCMPGEAVVFECPLGAKRVAVCSSPANRVRAATAQYRFGKPGAIELSLPARMTEGPSQISYSFTGYSGGGEGHLRVSNQGYDYIVFERTVRTNFGSRGRHDAEMTAGLVVRQGKRTLRKSLCTGTGTYGINSGPAETLRTTDFTALNE